MKKNFQNENEVAIICYEKLKKSMGIWNNIVFVSDAN